MRLQRHWIRSKAILKPVAALAREEPFLYLNAIQIFLSTVLIALPNVDVCLLWPVFMVEMFLDLRTSTFGRDGSDRMHILVFLALCVCYSFTDLRARSIGLIFIALSSMLAYFVSGLVKAISQQWRTGRSIALVLCSENYGAPALGRWIAKNSRACQAACWSVIIFETTFPLLVLFGLMPTACVLLAGIFFHISIAAAMGLNGFVWSFPATYPAIVFFSFKWHQHLMHMH